MENISNETYETVCDEVKDLALKGREKIGHIVTSLADKDITEERALDKVRQTLIL